MIDTEPPVMPFDVVGDGPLTLHFAHANGYPPLAYGRFLHALAGDRYRVLAAHHRPLWDDSDPWQTLTGWQLVADDLIRFLDRQQLRGITGVGHSLGAVTTLYVALQRPDLLSRIVLIEPVFLPPAALAAAYDPTADLRLLPMVATALRRRDRWESRAEAWARFRPRRAFDRFSDAALWEYVNAGLKPTGDGAFTLAYPREWEARFYSLPPRDIWELLPQVTQPTLALRAEHSDTLFPAAWTLWQSLQPAATFAEVADVGHMLTMEAPARVAAIVTEWLAAG